MTPEEAFDQFCEKQKLQFSSLLNPGMIWKAAWLEATRQAYLDAINICDEIGSENNPYAHNESDGAGACVDAIRQRLKEYDNEET